MVGTGQSGGSGGGGGSYNLFGGATGGTGGGGKNDAGDDGNTGSIGGFGGGGSNDVNNFSISGGGAGGAGAGGSGGGGGGGGSGGSAGGGGGGGGGPFGNNGGSGGIGGTGGTGGTGATGGLGGLAGAGGGAFEIIALGDLFIGNSAYSARGGDGQAGSLAPGNQTDGVSGGSAGSGVNAPGNGGTGGNGKVGGTGGSGGAGGSGGYGGGGAGGTVKLAGSVVDVNDINVDTTGGNGASVGGLGRFVFGSNTAASLGGSTLDAQVQGFAGIRASNPFLFNGQQTPFIPGLPSGAEVFGLTGLNAQTLLSIDIFDNAPAGTDAVLVRSDLGPVGLDDDFVGFDALLFANLSNNSINAPQLGVGADGYLVDLLNGGGERNAIFGGSAETITTLAPNAVYIVLIPEDATLFNIAGDGITASASTLANNQALFLAPGASPVNFDRVFAPAANQDLVVAYTPNMAPSIELAPVPPVDNSLTFSGNESVTIPDTVDITTAFTLEAWIRPTGDGIIMNSEREFEVARFDDGTIRYAIQGPTVPNDPVTTTGWAWHNTGYVAELNEWTHIAVSFDSVDGSISLYANGELVSQDTTVGEIEDVIDTTSPMTIGGRASQAQFFNGEIAEVQLWTVARDQQEIQNDINRDFDLSDPGLFGAWDLGNPADPGLDLTGNANGTLVAGPSVNDYSNIAARVLVSDPDFDAVAVQAFSDDSGVTVFVNQLSADLFEVRYNAAPDFVGSAVITIEVQDGPVFLHDYKGRTDTVKVEVSVNANELTGTVFNDLNANGIQDAGEAGVDGVQLMLSNGDITYSDATGYYRFAGLAPTEVISGSETASLTANNALLGSELIHGGATEVEIKQAVAKTVVVDNGFLFGGTSVVPVTGTKTTTISRNVEVTIAVNGAVDTIVLTDALTGNNNASGDLLNDIESLIAASPTLAGKVGVSLVNDKIVFSNTLGVFPASLTVEARTIENISVAEVYENQLVASGLFIGFVDPPDSFSNSSQVFENGLGFTERQEVSANDERSITVMVPGFAALTTPGDITREFTPIISAFSDLDFGLTRVVQIDAGADQSVEEGTPVNLTANIIDPDTSNGSNFSYLWEVSAVLDDPMDTFTPIAPGNASTFDFVPENDGKYLVTLTLTDNDNGGVQYVDSVQIVATRVNKAPDAIDDSYVVNEDAALTVDAAIGVVSNDVDADGDSLSAILQTGPTNGTLSFNPDGSFTYIPNEDFNGSDSFTYIANDGNKLSGVGTVNIDVLPTNDAPTATPDSGYTVNEDQILTIDVATGVLANDDDLDGDTVTARLITDAANGSVTLSEDGSFSYTPNQDFNGTDTFEYVANDGELDSNVVLVTLTVNPVNDKPIGVTDSYDLTEDGVLNVSALNGVLANDIDVENDSLSGLRFLLPQHGELVFNADGSFIYTPDADFNGTDSFSYLINDGSGIAFPPTTVTLNVAAENDVPQATNESYTVNENGVLTVDIANSVLNNDTDIDGDSLTATLTTSPANGSLEFNDDGTFTYTPDPDFFGADSFTYQASDGQAVSATAVVNIDVLPETLRVTNLSATADGFTASFNAPISLSTLNLYSGEAIGIDPADVIVVGDAAGVISGSLIVQPNTGTIRFLATGGPLLPDVYTVQLRSGVDGFVSQDGGQLDGNEDSVAGDNYTAQFTVSAPLGVSVSLPNFARGPGQDVDVPAIGAGIPLTISDGTGVNSVSLTLNYDPSLLTINSVTAGPSAPADLAISADTSAVGVVTLTVTTATGLAPGQSNFVAINATVPFDAPYHATQIIDIQNLSINGGAIQSVDGDGLQVIAYLGDVSGNAQYSDIDSQLMVPVVNDTATGFGAFPLVDPLVLADVNYDGNLTSFDRLILLQEIYGIDRPEIPAIPTLPPATANGTEADGDVQTAAVSASPVEQPQATSLLVETQAFAASEPATTAALNATSVSDGEFMVAQQLTVEHETITQFQQTQASEAAETEALVVSTATSTSVNYSTNSEVDPENDNAEISQLSSADVRIEPGLEARTADSQAPLRTHDATATRATVENEPRRTFRAVISATLTSALDAVSEVSKRVQDFEPAKLRRQDERSGEKAHKVMKGGPLSDREPPQADVEASKQADDAGRFVNAVEPDSSTDIAIEWLPALDNTSHGPGANQTDASHWTREFVTGGPQAEEPSLRMNEIEVENSDGGSEQDGNSTETERRLWRRWKVS